MGCVSIGCAEGRTSSTFIAEDRATLVLFCASSWSGVPLRSRGRESRSSSAPMSARRYAVTGFGGGCGRSSASRVAGSERLWTLWSSPDRRRRRPSSVPWRRRCDNSCAKHGCWRTATGTPNEGSLAMDKLVGVPVVDLPDTPLPAARVTLAAQELPLCADVFAVRHHCRRAPWDRQGNGTRVLARPPVQPILPRGL